MYFDGLRRSSYRPVLDIGCGTGHSIRLGSIYPEDYMGIDISEKMVATAKKKNPNYCFLQHDATKPFPAKFGMFLALYGQINYFGFMPFLRMLEHCALDHLSFLLILYAKKDRDCVYKSGDPDKMYFSSYEVENSFRSTGIDISMYGFSYPQEEARITVSAQKERMMECDPENNVGYKYLMVEGFRDA